jgi:hypothetical protein
MTVTAGTSGARVRMMDRCVLLTVCAEISVDWIFRVGYGLDWVFAPPIVEINVLLG